MTDAKTVPHRMTGLPIRTLSVEVVLGKDAGKRFTARSETIGVGTASDNELVLTDDTVSRYHLELQHTGGRIAVRDHGSTNGTAVGKSDVLVEKATIPAGTILTLGKTQIRVDDGTTIDLEVHEEDRLGPLAGRSPVMRRLMAQIKKVATSDASVLLLGETGAGKEVVARAIHETSPRASKPFETVDCGALAPTLIASELFGHERGAFTGADKQYAGAFERAHGGTLFLDEIGELPASLQTVLLGALERRSFRRVGGTERIDVDVRVVCATNRDLRSEVNTGTFRQDLFYRIAVVRLPIPPLRERVEDIPLLVEHFLRNAGWDGPVEEVIPQNAMDGLAAYRWPGNVRELKNFVEAALAMGEAPELENAGRVEKPRKPSREDVDDSEATHDGSLDRVRPGRFPSVPIAELLALSYKDARAKVLDEFEGIFLADLMAKAGGNVSEAARVSKIHRSYLIQMLKRHGLK